MNSQQVRVQSVHKKIRNLVKLLLFVKDNLSRQPVAVEKSSADSNEDQTTMKSQADIFFVRGKLKSSETAAAF